MTISPSNRINLTGYVTPRQFGPFIMPVPAQNSCLREYAMSKDYIYGMPQCEHIFPHCFMQLFSTVNSVPEDGHVAMYSFHMMPDKRENIEKLLEIQQTKRLTFHYVLEKKTANSAEEIHAMRRALYIAKITQQNDSLRQAINLATMESQAKNGESIEQFNL
jgi:sporadic carbohydrate cluster protein (TIGR04323 family)